MVNIPTGAWVAVSVSGRYRASLDFRGIEGQNKAIQALDGATP